MNAVDKSFDKCQKAKIELNTYEQIELNSSGVDSPYFSFEFD